MQHRGAVSPHGLIFFCIVCLFVLGLFAMPTVAQDDGSGPPAATPARGSNDNAAQNQYNAADAQYADDVIKDTIPDKKILVDTGGPILPIIGAVILAIGLVGLGIFLLRRT
jgi:hypothetical protein